MGKKICKERMTRIGASTQLCFTALEMSNGSETFPSERTTPAMSSRKRQPCFDSMTQGASLFTISNVLAKSIKVTYRYIF